MNPKLKELLWPGIALIFAGVVGTLTNRAAEQRIVEARQVVEEAGRTAKFAAAEAARQRLAAAKAQEQADSARAAAAQAETQAKALRQELARLETRFSFSTAVAPDTCQRVVQDAQAALAVAKREASRWETAFHREQVASAELRRANDSLTTANDGLTAALENLRMASAGLVAATKPSWFRRVLPEMHFGVTAGLDMTGQPRIVVGVGVGWGL